MSFFDSAPSTRSWCAPASRCSTKPSWWRLKAMGTSGFRRTALDEPVGSVFVLEVEEGTANGLGQLRLLPGELES
jgi:hypothetical protein